MCTSVSFPSLNRDVAQQLHAVFDVDLVFCRNLVDLCQVWPNIVDLAKLDQKGHIVVKLAVLLIVVPGSDGQCVFRLK